MGIQGKHKALRERQDAVIAGYLEGKKTKEEVFEEHTPLAAAAAEKEIRFFWLEDGIQVALLELWECIDDFDPSHGVPFVAYAMRRMRWTVRRFRRNTEGTIRVANSKFDRGVRVLTVSLDEALAKEAKTKKHSDLPEVMAEALKVLTPREAQVVKLRFYDDMTFLQIAEVCGFSKQRAEQLHANALLKLNARFELFPYLEL